MDGIEGWLDGRNGTMDEWIVAAGVSFSLLLFLG
jgi:hypothetical protein